MNRQLLMAVAVCTVLPLYGQDNKEGVTNAFLDLQRKGEFVAAQSQMQVAAKAVDVVKLLDEKPACQYFLFAEDRFHDIVRTDSLPKSWLERTVSERTSLKIQASPGEYLTWQVGVYTPFRDLTDIEIRFSNFSKKGGGSLDGKKPSVLMLVV